MNLNSSDADVEMEMDMTPMIDVTFLLIIFFMIITDLSQQDLEDLQLPVARTAKPDKPNPDEWRPVINIPQSGNMIIKRKDYYVAENDDPAQMMGWLVDTAERMEPDEDDPSLPGESLLIRADEWTEFKYIQRVMQWCGDKDIQIWKIQLAAGEDPEAKAEREAAGN
ncbi:MAG: biopolymer transport protein ExbD [Planctomycetota bacterium]|jgi:biopolymer transport protein ExbD